MERIEYDPEIDPSIREEREAAEKERELSARIRLEIERYVEENDLVPRVEAGQEAEKEEARHGAAQNGQAAPIPAPWDENPGGERQGGEGSNAADGSRDTGEAGEESARSRRRREKEAKEAARREKAEARNARRTQNAARATSRRKAVKSVFTGSILGSEQMRRMWPYLLGVAAVLVLYIAYSFHVQTLHLHRQRLETEVRELGIEAVERTAERVRQTRRSAIVARLRAKNIPLEEFPDPVKKIER